MQPLGSVMTCCGHKAFQTLNYWTWKLLLIRPNGRKHLIRIILPEVWGEWSPSSPEASLSALAPRTPIGKAWSPEAKSASGSSLTGKEMSLMASTLIFGDFESSRAFSGFTSRSYSSDRSLLSCRNKIFLQLSRSLDDVTVKGFLWSHSALIQCRKNIQLNSQRYETD